MAQFGVKFVWRNKFRPTKKGVVGPNLFCLVQTKQLRRTLFSGWRALASLVFLVWLGNPGALEAAELIGLEVSNTGNTYRVRLEMELDVATDRVHAVLTDYQQIHRLNPAIVESRLLPSPDGTTARVYTRMESCVLFYCTRFSRVEDVRQPGPGEITAVIVPELSDFKSGTAVWHIRAYGDRSRLVYEASMQPGLFIPPLLGSYLLKRKLRDELLVSFKRIECCAKSRLRLSETRDDGDSIPVRRPRVC